MPGGKCCSCTLIWQSNNIQAKQHNKFTGTTSHFNNMNACVSATIGDDAIF